MWIAVYFFLHLAFPIQSAPLLDCIPWRPTIKKTSAIEPTIPYSEGLSTLAPSIYNAEAPFTRPLTKKEIINERKFRAHYDTSKKQLRKMVDLRDKVVLEATKLIEDGIPPTIGSMADIDRADGHGQREIFGRNQDYIDAVLATKGQKRVMEELNRSGRKYLYALNLYPNTHIRNTVGQSYSDNYRAHGWTTDATLPHNYLDGINMTKELTQHEKEEALLAIDILERDVRNVKDRLIHVREGPA